MKNNAKKTLFKGATILGLGTFLSKILGAIYRIPLTNYLGSSGIGLYQMVFPVYALLLDFSGCALPSAMSKIIAGFDDKKTKAKEFFSVCVKIFSLLGLFLSILLIVFAKPLSVLQGNYDAYLGYIFLSPSIFFVSLISCFRGYFQGALNMMPTAVSQIIEQIIKLTFGIILVKILAFDTRKAVAGATFAITISEIVALIMLFVWYKKKSGFSITNKERSVNFISSAKLIFKVAIPITLVGIIIPFSQVIDSFLTINIIGAYRNDATALYGLLGGVALTIVNLPVSICHGIATISIPTISSQKDEKEQRKSTISALAITLIFSLFCALFCFIFAPLIVNILFRSLSSIEKSTAISLLKVLSPCIVLLSITQTLNGVLIGKGKTYLPVISLSLGVIIKIALSLILLKQPSVNIYGGAIAIIACYFFTCLVNLLMIFKFKVKNAIKNTCRREYANQE